MAREDYQKALKKGERSYARYLSEGKYPYLQVLEELLSHTDVVAEEDLGICSIPSELIVGTFTAGRRTAFAPNFMPLLDEESEFAAKWQALYNAHLEEGIHDPIKCYEFMNRYYVLEGNKRVSVLKFCGAPSVQGNVTRIIPKRTDEPENRLYFEFLAFYKYSKVTLYSASLEAIGFYWKNLDLRQIIDGQTMIAWRSALCMSALKRYIRKREENDRRFRQQMPF